MIIIKIYLAGGESMAKILRQYNAQNVLVSFYYLREKGKKSIERILRDFPNVFLDSGAFTLQQQLIKAGIPITQATDSPQMQEYINDYIGFVNNYGEGFRIVAEVDVGSWQQKTRFRERIEHGITNRTVLSPVIHRTDPDAYLEYICKHYPYIALGGLRTGRTISELKKYVGKRLIIPQQYGTKVHGFAITVVDIMRSMGMASADSASWLHGGKHGMTFWFDGRHLRAYDKFQKWYRLRFKEEVKNLGINWEDFLDDKPSAVNGFNLSQWLKFQEYLESEGEGLGMFKQSQEKFWRDRGNEEFKM